MDFKAGELYVHKDSNTVYTYMGSQYVGHNMDDPVRLTFKEITGTMKNRVIGKQRADQIMLLATPMVKALYARKQD